MAEAILSVTNLIKEYAGGTRAVSGVSFAVGKGEIFAFLGPNGAGKTTTIKILTTLLRPTSGTVRIGGFDPVAEQAAARRMFGIVFQDPSLDDELTARENMELHAVLYGVPREVYLKRIAELLAMVELTDRADDFIKNFSGGMKRRLEIARALTHHPKILFLDEPTLGLDPQTRNRIWGYVKDLNEKEGMTVFFTTHYMDEAARVAHRIAVIDRGTIVAEGTPDALKERTHTATLEEAFLALTGHGIREEEAGTLDNMRTARKMWGRK